MKKGYWWIIVGIILVSLPIAYFFWFKKPAEKTAFELLKEIPDNAQVILMADAGKIGKIIGKELFYHPQKVLEIKERLATEDQYDEIFDGLGDAGIKYQDKLVMYITGKDTSDLANVTLLGIEDRKKFRSFFHHEMPNKIKYRIDSIDFDEADAHYIDSLKLMFAWNNHFLSATNFVKRPSEERVQEILTDLFDREGKMGADSLYLDFIAQEHEVGLWIQTEEALNPGVVKMKSSPFKAMCLDVKFVNEKCVMKGAYHLKDSMDISMLPFRMGLKGRIPKDTSQLFLQMALEPSDYEIDRSQAFWAGIDSVLMKNGLDLEEIKSTWNGYADLELKGIKKKVETFVKIEFDDNFNEVRKETTKEVLYPEFISAIGVTASGDEVLRKLETKKIIQANESGGYNVLDVFSVPVHLKKQGEYWMISTQKDVAWVSDSAESPVFRIDLDYQQCQYDTGNVLGTHSWTDHFIRSNPNMDHVRFEVRPSAKGLSIEGEVSFIGENTNGLIEMLDVIMSMKAKMQADSGSVEHTEDAHHTN